jgi:enoyl-CoA hydratase/carnithine racemase
MNTTKNYQYEFLKTALDDGILTLSFNRPETFNAINSQMEAELYEALRRAEDDDAVRVVVLTGEGKHFSAGHDIRQVAAEVVGGQPAASFQGRNWARTGLMLPSWEFTKPLIAGVQGYVGPHANAILMTCDYVIATDDCRFSFEEARVGTGMPYGPYVLLAFHFPMRVLKKLWMSAGWMDAQQALSLHYVQRVVSRNELLAETMRHARQAALFPSRDIRANKKGIHQMYDLWGLLQMAVLGRDAYQPEGESLEKLIEHFQVIHKQGVGAASKLRDRNVDENVTKV